MTRKIQMVVDGQVFKTKKSLREKCQGILKRYNPGESLPHEDQRFLACLLTTYHPEADLKVGVGIRRIRVDRDGYGYKCFWLDRTDGSTTDFSFNSCITHPSLEKDAKAAFRNAIYPDIQDFKMKRMLEVTHCEYSGDSLEDVEIHVDHKPPNTFDSLLLNFMSSKGITWNDVPVSPTHDGVAGSWLEDSELESEWREYHNANAELRLVSKRRNLSDIKKEAS